MLIISPECKRNPMCGQVQTAAFPCVSNYTSLSHCQQDISTHGSSSRQIHFSVQQNCFSGNLISSLRTSETRSRELIQLITLHSVTELRVSLEGGFWAFCYALILFNCCIIYTAPQYKEEKRKTH